MTGLRQSSGGDGSAAVDMVDPLDYLEDDEDGEEDEFETTSDMLGLGGLDDSNEELMAYDDSDDEDYDETVDSDPGESSDDMLGPRNQVDGADDSEVSLAALRH